MGLFMRLNLKYQFIFYLAILFFGMLKYNVYAESVEVEHENRRVLFLSSYSYSWASIPYQVNGIKESLEADQFTINYEFMDTKNTSYGADYAEFYQYIQFKLKDRLPYDGVIIGDDAALQFALLYKEALFPNTPIVFQGIDDIDQAIVTAKDPLITGVVEKVNYEANIKLADLLFPNATRLVLIYDDLENGIGIANQLKDAGELFKKYEIEYLNTSTHTKSEFIEKLSSFDEESIVFGISIGEQKDHLIYSEDERYKMIQEHAKVPVFSITHAGVGNGMFGGYVIDHHASGYLAGEMMKSILLEGKFPEVEQNTPSTYFFDYNIMKEYGIPLSKLPAKAEIINEPESFLQKHAILITTLLSVGLIIAMIAYHFRYQANVRLQKLYGQLVIAEADLKKQYERNQKHTADLVQQEKHIRYQAEHDDLTTLPNRRMIMKQLKRLLKESRNFTIVIIDLDDFKEINDTYGHASGDYVLNVLAQRFLKLMEEDQIYVSRFGGDEFLVIINQVDFDENSIMMTRIQEVMSTPILHGDIQCHIKMSMGIADTQDHITEVSELVSNADIALHEAKRIGKNRFVYYDPLLREKLMEIKKIRDLLSEACEKDGFHLLYQPQIDVHTGEIHAYEALIRLKSNPMSPAEFIPVAEKTDKILKMGRIVVKKVIEQIVEWRAHGFELRPIAINFSTKQIRDKGYVDYLKKLLATHHVSPSLIQIEFTESIFIDNDEQAEKLFADFKALGIQLALDDFGTGYSSIRYLTYIPVDKIKLDKSIVDIYLQEGKDSFIENVIRLSHSLNLKITVEGVEEAAQYERLKALGCDYVQGYYFSKPISAEEVEKLNDPIK